MSQPSTNGVMSISCLLPFDQYDVIRGHPLDYMHGVLLGVVKALINHWNITANKKEAFFLNKVSRNLLNQRIQSLKLCNFIRRRPRSLEDRNLFKANEYRTMLLYILPITLQGILKDKYYKHFCLLSSAVYKLLRPKIPLNTLTSIEGDLIKFVAEYGILYGLHRVTMNVHRLLHLVDSVKYSGPLWATSLFSFESNNAYILRFINGSKDILLQIACKYSLASCLSNNNKNTNEQKQEVKLKNPIEVLLNEEQKAIFHYLGILNVKAFASMNYNNIKYTSINYTLAKLTADYFVKLEDDMYVKILFYLKHSVLGNLMMIQRFEVYTHFHQFVELIEDVYDVVDVALIKEKVIYLKQNHKHYVVERPNSYEKD